LLLLLQWLQRHLLPLLLLLVLLLPQGLLALSVQYYLEHLVGLGLAKILLLLVA
jgi:hypothetical protein